MLKIMTKEKKIKAFTLAEVLITLGLIGVVAALTIPNLIKNYQKQETATKLEKVYTTLAQAVRQSENDNGSCADWKMEGANAIETKANFDMYLGSYIKILKYCVFHSDAGYTTNYPWLFLNKSPVTMGVVYNVDRTSVILPDGVFLVVSDNNHFYIDLNAGKGPNIYGKDVFEFVLVKNRGLMPHNYDQPISIINSNCSNVGSGTCCTIKIMKDGWKIADDYPWN